MKSLLTVLLIWSCTVSAQDITWDKKVFSYKAELGEKGVSFQFTAKNNTGSLIEISKGKSSCACMTLKTQFPVKVQPGQTVTIDAHYDFTGKIGLNKGTLYMSVPGKKDELKVEVDIPVPVTISPRFIIWKKGDASEKKIKVIMHPDYKGTIDSAACLDTNSKIGVNMTKADDGYGIKVTPPALGKISKKRTWILIEGKDGQGKKQEYRVYLIFN